MRLILLFLFMFSVFCYGCGPGTIDASNEQTLTQSIKALRSELSTPQQQDFDNALKDIDDILFNPSFAVTQATIGFSRPESLIKRILDGKSAEDVIIMVRNYKLRNKLLMQHATEETATR